MPLIKKKTTIIQNHTPDPDQNTNNLAHYTPDYNTPAHHNTPNKNDVPTKNSTNFQNDANNENISDIQNDANPRNDAAGNNSGNQNDKDPRNDKDIHNDVNNQNNAPDRKNAIARATARVAPTVSDIVGAYKSLVANACLDIYKSKNEMMGKLWQRNYHEHIIRNENSYQRISNYIINNPANWQNDKFYT